MRVETKAYGGMDIDERQLIHMQGLYGFDSLTDFALLDARQPSFYWLQSTENIEVAFVLIDPKIVCPDYFADLDPFDLEILGLEGPRDEAYLEFVIVTIPEDKQNMTANLQGPIIINKKTRESRQCISCNDSWQVRHRIFDSSVSSGENLC